MDHIPDYFSNRHLGFNNQGSIPTHELDLGFNNPHPNSFAYKTTIKAAATKNKLRGVLAPIQGWCVLVGRALQTSSNVLILHAPWIFFIMSSTTRPVAIAILTSLFHRNLISLNHEFMILPDEIHCQMTTPISSRASMFPLSPLPLPKTPKVPRTPYKMITTDKQQRQWKKQPWDCQEPQQPHPQQQAHNQSHTPSLSSSSSPTASTTATHIPTPTPIPNRLNPIQFAVCLNEFERVMTGLDRNDDYDEELLVLLIEYYIKTLFLEKGDKIQERYYSRL